MNERFLTLLLLLVSLWATSLSAAAEQFEVAAGQRVLNPEVGAYLAGYGPDRQATGRLDDLFLKAALIRAGRDQLVIMSLDNIGLTYPDVSRVRAAVAAALPGVHVVFSSTHTHAGPDVVGIWGPALWRSGREGGYVDELVESAAALVRSGIAST